MPTASLWAEPRCCRIRAQPCSIHECFSLAPTLGHPVIGYPATEAVDEHLCASKDQGTVKSNETRE